jgi:arylsulfatase A-like enzyme
VLKHLLGIDYRGMSVRLALRTPRWKYAVTAPGADAWNDPGAERYVESHLYDLQSDPWELDNLVSSPDHVEIRNSLRPRLLERMKQAGEPPAVVELSH